MIYSIYILYSRSGDLYYVGCTSDVNRRLEEHNRLLEDSFSSRHRPWELVFSYEVGADLGLARKIENHIKRQKSRVYLERIISAGSLSQLVNCISSVV